MKPEVNTSKKTLAEVLGSQVEKGVSDQKAANSGTEARVCDTVARSSTCFADTTAVTHHGDTRLGFAYFPAHALPFCSHITSDASFNNDVLMYSMHSAAPPVCHVHTQHCMTPYCTDSTQPGVLLLCLLLASSALIAHFER